MKKTSHLRASPLRLLHKSWELMGRKASFILHDREATWAQSGPDDAVVVGTVCRQAQGRETQEGWRHAAVEVDNMGATG